MFLRPLSTLLLVLLMAAPAAGQSLKGTFGVGADVSFVRTESDELDTSVRLRPSLSRIPSSGWGLALALNWYDAKVDGASAAFAGELGRVAIRPLMAGVGYTVTAGRFSVTPSVVGGVALNRLTIDDALDSEVEVIGSGFERRVGKVSGVVRPGVNVTYALLPRLGLNGFGGYLVNRPTFDLRTPAGDIRTRWSADGLVVSGGVVVSLF